MAKDALSSSRSPPSVSGRLSKIPRRLLTSSAARESQVCRSGVPSTVAPKSTPSGAEQGGEVADGGAPAGHRPRQAVQHVVEPHRVEAPGAAAARGRPLGRAEGRRGASRRGGVGQDVGVRVQEQDAGAGGQPGVREEVAGAGADVEVAPAHVPGVVRDQAASRAPPHQRAEDPEHQGVVELEEPRRVDRVAQRWPVRRARRRRTAPLRAGHPSRRSVHPPGPRAVLTGALARGPGGRRRRVATRNLVHDGLAVDATRPILPSEPSQPYGGSHRAAPVSIACGMRTGPDRRDLTHSRATQDGSTNGSTWRADQHGRAHRVPSSTATSADDRHVKGPVP